MKITTRITLLLICGFFIFPISLADKNKTASEAVATLDTPAEHRKKHADPSYICPMHPQIVRGKSGKCPICGMDLVKQDIPTYKNKASKKAEKYPSVTINPSVAQNMGVRKRKVSYQKLSQKIETVGNISYDENSFYHVHPRSTGWIEAIYVKAEGDKITQGKKLLEYYSPELYAAQKDYLIALKSNDLLTGNRNNSLAAAAKRRLILLGLDNSLIEKIAAQGRAETRIPIYAAGKGIITAINVQNGMYIKPAVELYKIADLSSIWVIVDVFEHQLNWIKVGDKAHMKIEALPDQSWKGKIDYIYPDLNKNTRTLKVRLKFTNKNNQLKPNMFADVTLFGISKKCLVIPQEAIILTAESPRVIKVTAKNKYQPVKIKTGIKTDGFVEIKKGLKAGDEVIVSGQFLLDSESNLQASFLRFSSE